MYGVYSFFNPHHSPARKGKCRRKHTDVRRTTHGTIYWEMSWKVKGKINIYFTSVIHSSFPAPLAESPPRAAARIQFDSSFNILWNETTTYVCARFGYARFVFLHTHRVRVISSRMGLSGAEVKAVAENRRHSGVNTFAKWLIKRKKDRKGVSLYLHS